MCTPYDESRHIYWSARVEGCVDHFICLIVISFYESLQNGSSAVCKSLRLMKLAKCDFIPIELM